MPDNKFKVTVNGKKRIEIKMWGFWIVPLIYLIVCAFSSDMRVTLFGLLITFAVGGILDIAYHIVEIFMNK